MSLLLLFSGGGPSHPQTLEAEAERLLSFLDDSASAQLYELALEIGGISEDLSDEERVRRAIETASSNPAAELADAVRDMLAPFAATLSELADRVDRTEQSVQSLAAAVPPPQRHRVAAAIALFVAAVATLGLAIGSAATGDTRSTIAELAVALWILAELIKMA